jgi:hypothetical protein
MTRHKVNYPKPDKQMDLNRPIEVGEPMKDLRRPLPQRPTETQKRRWDWYLMRGVKATPRQA